MKTKHILIIAGLIVAIVVSFIVMKKLQRKSMIDTLVDRLALNRAELEAKSTEELEGLMKSLTKE